MHIYLGNTSIRWYYVFLYAGCFAVLIFNLLQLRRKKQFPGKLSQRAINKNPKDASKETKTAVIEIVLITFSQYLLGGAFNEILGDIIDTNANYYGLACFGPLFVAITCLLLGTDLIKVFDMITPSYALGLFFSKTGCFFAGCCRGIEWEHGLYNYKYKEVQFPVQALEAGIAITIFVFMLFRRKKAKKGTMFPTYLMLYSSTRFFSEFLRGEDDVLWRFKTYHFLCLAGFIVGFIEYIIAVKYADRISRIFAEENKIDVLCNKISEKIAEKRKKYRKLFFKYDKQIVHHKKRKPKNRKKTTHKK